MFSRPKQHLCEYNTQCWTTEMNYETDKMNLQFKCPNYCTFQLSVTDWLGCEFGKRFFLFKRIGKLFSNIFWKWGSIKKHTSKNSNLFSQPAAKLSLINSIISNFRCLIIGLYLTQALNVEVFFIKIRFTESLVI